jgi:hypothetical protein
MDGRRSRQISDGHEDCAMPIRPASSTFAQLIALAFLAAAPRAWPAEPPHEQMPEHEHGHAHDAAGAAVAKLTLDGDRKWPTDAALRSGMAAIQAAFDEHHPAIHQGRETDAQYEALAARIEAEVNSIVANCKLPPAADANLHLVVADLLSGVGLMRGQDPARTRHDGAAQVHVALNAYPRFFDDPTQGGDGAH